MFIKRSSEFDVQSVGLLKTYVSSYYHINRNKNFFRNAHYIFTLDKRFFPSVVYLNNL